MEYPEYGKIPVNESSPAGSDVSYEPEFEELQQEIDRLSIATAPGEGVNWEKVAQLSELILKEKSKNLLVAAYLAQALIKTKGITGFIEGSVVLSDIVENFWESLYPPKKRKKGRLNAIKWWFDKAELFAKNLPENTELTTEEYEILKNSIKKIDSVLFEKTDDAPVLKPLIDICERIPVKSEQLPEEPVQSTEKSEAQETTAEPENKNEEIKLKAPEPKTVKKPLSEPAGEIESSKDALRVLNQAMNTSVKSAGFLFSEDKSDFRSYKIFRFYVWAEVNKLPMIENENNTVLPPPDSKIRSSLEAMFNAGEYENVIELAEKSLRNHIFWIDLNRFCASALDELGKKYLQAKITVESESLELVNKIPGIENLCFSDGTPFADNETRAWLNSLKSSSDNTSEPDLSGSEDDIFLNAVFTEKEAKKLLKEKKGYEAVYLFEEKISGCSSLRDKIIYLISLSNFFLESGKPELAYPQLNKIESYINDYNINIWEPAVAVKGLTIIYKILKQDKNKDKQNKANQILDQISEISPAAGFKTAGI
ncbi:MAG: type VI secretion system protein TssA [Thermodesulfobacteriota bacterium]